MQQLRCALARWSAWRAKTPMLALLLAMAMLTACAPFGESWTPGPPSHAELATVTAAANATFVATTQQVTPAALPALQVDPGWVAVAQVTDSSRLGGPQVLGGPPGSGIASVTMTLGTFTLSSAATVVVMFSCSSLATAHATVAISVYGETVRMTCGATAVQQRDQMRWTPSDAGRKLTVTATISTDSEPPQWRLLVEQPK